MKSVFVGTATLLAAWGLPAAAYGQSAFVNYTVLGRVFDHTQKNIFQTGNKVDPNVGVTITADVSDSIRDASASALISATGAYKTLRVYAAGFANAPAGSSEAFLKVDVSAGFSDTLTIGSNELPDLQVPVGTMVRYEVDYFLDGTLGASGVGHYHAYQSADPYADGSGAALLLLSGTGVDPGPHPNGYYAWEVQGTNNSSSFQPRSYDPPMTFHVSRDVPFGLPAPLSVTMRVIGEAYAGNGSGGMTFPFPASGQFAADFSHTLKWGGITSVTVVETGAPLLGWTVSSASGIDYSQPAPVPEPSSWLQGVAGVAMVMARSAGVRRASRIARQTPKENARHAAAVSRN